MEMNMRIKEIRQALGLTQIEFSNKLGIRQSSLSAIESGVTESISERNIIIICKEFGVSEDWLRNGEGEIFRSNGNLMSLLGSKISELDEMDKKILLEYIKLNTKQRNAIKDFIKNLF